MKPSSLFCFVFLSLRTEQLILHEKTEAQHTVPQPALGRTRSSSRALLVPAARFPPLAARWSPSMRRERQIHIRVFPLTFHWLPQPLGLRAELLPEPVRTVGSSQTQKGAGFWVFFVVFLLFILGGGWGGRTPQQFQLSLFQSFRRSATLFRTSAFPPPGSRLRGLFMCVSVEGSCCCCCYCRVASSPRDVM